MREMNIGIKLFVFLLIGNLALGHRHHIIVKKYPVTNPSYEWSPCGLRTRSRHRCGTEDLGLGLPPPCIFVCLRVSIQSNEV
ncbi:hypothetical protein RIF29_30666 [Crotalaria pallida]|uniref:Secreted protein n=1 Tax=Crotalaria pallida TaxID=3830 RepID=A0AAN9EGN5_CROPI